MGRSLPQGAHEKHGVDTFLGDYVFPDFQQDLEDIIDRGVAVSLLYGDADYIVSYIGEMESSHCSRSGEGANTSNSATGSPAKP